MISKSQIKLVTSLGHKKYREALQLFVAEGTKIAEELLRSPFQVENVYALAEWVLAHEDHLRNVARERITLVSDREMDQISQLTTPSPVLLLLRQPAPDFVLPRTGINLCLDSIRDPGNLGTIIRLADWYGLENIYCSEDCVDAFNPKTVQASMGSIARVKVHYTSLSILIHEAKLAVYAATAGGEENLHEIETLENDCLLLIGSESHGLREELEIMAQHRVAIPRIGKAESLNAAAATAILLDNFIRLSRKR